MMTTFGERLRALRAEKQLSQAELARQLGLTKSSLNMYERGEREPRFETLAAIAAYFGTDLNDLLGIPRTAHRDRIAPRAEAAAGASLSPGERELLGAYRALDAEGRALLLQTARFALGRAKNSLSGD